ncbi:MAG: SCO family protein [Caulobacteraceae bacterium]|nr:SCO family protein [Caulobacteraceae bacterium]
MQRLAPWIAVAAASLMLLAAVAWRTASPAGGQGAAQIGGDFHLVDQTGRAVDASILKGKWSAVFFGYTYCPDVCPTTLQTLGTATAGLGARAKDFQVVFVTVDPHRDTPTQLADYLSSASFPKGTIGLTGSDAQVAQAAADYKVYFQKEGQGGAYSVDHSSAVYLMNPQGRFDSVIAFGLTPDQVRDSILRAMDGKSA